MTARIGVVPRAFGVRPASLLPDCNPFWITAMLPVSAPVEKAQFFRIGARGIH